ncbi:MAG: hypothetical protein MJA83_14395, partial [Gammaproteobacteria bacterium]|nr:hypothetical protein [Gammaproteobacteria bacterium]
MQANGNNNGIRRPPVTVMVLIASLLMVGVLAWQAIDSARSHQETAENVLQDYSRLAADEFISRGVREIFLYGITPLFNALDQMDKQVEPRGVIAQLFALKNSPDDGIARAATLIN